MKLYGIDFNVYACGGVGCVKLQRMYKETLLFFSESKMLEKVAELKASNNCGEIKPFITYILDIHKEKYEI